MQTLVTDQVGQSQELCFKQVRQLQEIGTDLHITIYTEAMIFYHTAAIILYIYGQRIHGMYNVILNW